MNYLKIKQNEKYNTFIYLNDQAPECIKELYVFINLNVPGD